MHTANPPNPLLPPSPLSRDSASLYLSPPFAALLFIRSPFLSYLPFPFPFCTRRTGSVVMLITGDAPTRGAHSRTISHTNSQVETCLHLYLYNDECLRDRSPPGVALSLSLFLRASKLIGAYSLHARSRALYTIDVISMISASIQIRKKSKPHEARVRPCLA